MQWLIETFNANRSVNTFLVKAKTYGEACTKISQYHGECSFKLLGQYEQLETEKNISVRVS